MIPRTLLICLILVVPGVAFAQSPADESNQRGMEAFADGDFAGAAEHFARAYQLEPDPAFRKSEAVAWFKAERCNEAIEAANAFILKWKGAPGEADEASSVIANCKVDLAEEAMAAGGFELAETLLGEAEEAARDDYTRDRISGARVELTRLRAEQKSEPEESLSADPAIVADPEPVEPAPRSKLPATLALAVGGAATVGAAALHVLTLTSTVPALEEAQTGDRDTWEARARRVDTARILVPTLYALGGLGIGVGVWLSIDPPSETESNPNGEVTAGFSWSQRF